MVELRGLGFPSNNIRLLYEYELAKRIKPVVDSLEATISDSLKKNRLVPIDSLFAAATHLLLS